MPKIVNHAEYRKELLQKSFDVFAQRNYSSLTMRDLAKALNVSTGTLYHYFPTKFSIFEALLVQFVDEDIQDFTSRAGKTVSFEDGLDKLFAWLEENEERCAKLTFLQIDAFRSQDEKVASMVDEVFSSEKMNAILSDQLFIDDSDVSDFLGVWIGGMLIDRKISRSKVKWSNQKALIKEFLSKYAKDSPSSKRNKKTATT